MTDMTSIASAMIRTLRTSDPDLDTSVGSTTRKIIDAVAEQIAEANLDQRLMIYQYDIDAKIGADLDDFVQLFGMTRLSAKRATGTVTFSRSGALSRLIFIPVRTEIRTTTMPQIVVQTATGAYLEVGSESVTVPVQAVEGGSSGNVAAEALTVIGTPVQGVSRVINLSPLSGGSAQETDNELRARWKRTVFRNLAGTEQMYLGIVLDDPDCYQANVVGSSKGRREQVQVVSGFGTTTVDDAAYVFTSPVFVGNNIDSGDIFLKGSDYSWDTSVNPPRVAVLNAAVIPNGSVIEVDYEYSPDSSRNDPGAGITNRVDIWVGGQRAQSAVQSVIFRDAAEVKFNNTVGSSMNKDNYIRSDLTRPTVGNYFVPLAFGPILSIPSTISIGTKTYALATASKPMGTSEVIGGETIYYSYRLVHRDGPHGYSTVSAFGLEWHYEGTGTWRPSNNATFTVGGSGESYTYNRLISDLQGEIDRWRLLGTDALVHQATKVELRLSLAIVYNRGANKSQVDNNIRSVVSDAFTKIGFQARVQVSDLLQLIHNVEGVDNVRFLHDDDYSGYNPATPNAYQVGIQRMVEGAVYSSYVDNTGRAYDIRFGDAELPVLHSIYIVTKAENSFGVF